MQPTAALQRSLRRMPLTTKQGPHNYYKGNRTGAMGRHTKWGGYILDYKKIRTYVCPDLAGFQMTPFVTEEDYKPDANGSRTKIHNELKKIETFGRKWSAKRYLQIWKDGGGEKEIFWQS